MIWTLIIDILIYKLINLTSDYFLGVCILWERKLKKSQVSYAHQCLGQYEIQRPFKWNIQVSSFVLGTK